MSESLAEILKSHWPELAPERAELVLRYYDLLVDENSRQNLTRLISPQDFFTGHCEDVRALQNSGLLDFPAFDLGSGAGVPGLLSALTWGGKWVLCESEKMKATFLERAVETLKVPDVSVVAVRGEEYLKKNRVQSITARAVGPVERINNWFRSCSTWNNLVLFKGPGWDEEWKIFLASSKRNELKIEKTYTYTVGPEAKQRIIVRLSRTKSGLTARE